MTSEHYSTERESRECQINFGIGVGHVVDDFVINRGHKDGPEIHILTSTGIIVIKNYYTHKIVTKLIARPQQILLSENSSVRISELHLIWQKKHLYKNKEPANHADS